MTREEERPERKYHMNRSSDRSYTSRSSKEERARANAMSVPPNSPPGQGTPNSWYPTSANGSGPRFPSSVPSQQSPYGSPYGVPIDHSPYPGRHNGGPYETQYGMPPGQQPPPPQPSGSGGVVKWLVIGCLGCAGILVLGFLAMIILAIIDSPSSDESAGSRPTSTIESGASDAGGAESTPESTKAADEDAPADDDAGPVDPSAIVKETDTATVTIISTERTQVLRDSWWESTTDNEYFVIDISYENKSSESLSIWASDIILVDTEGREHDANTDVSLALENPIIIEDVNPGLTITGTLVYETPPGTQFSELRFESRYGSGEELTISFE